MNEFRADLHCHSYFSDGTLSPAELIDLAINSGLKGLSITDHDTLAAYPSALPYAQEKNFPLLTGVEFSTTFKEESIHVLAYGFSLESKYILDLISKHAQRRAKRNSAILARLKALHINLSEDEIMSLVPGGVVGRPHIALALIRRGYVSDMRAAFSKYLGDNKPAFVQGEKISLEETLEIIHKGGGKAILAHPLLIPKKNLLKKLLNLPFDGIEAYYGTFPRSEVEPILKIAEEKKWLITGGSDFHGKIKPTPLGASWTPEETFNLLANSL